MATAIPLKIITGEVQQFATGDFVSVANGGTGAITAAAARTNLGVGNLGTLNNDSSTLIQQALGSTIQEQTFSVSDINLTAGGTLTSGAVFYYPIWSKSAQTISGFKWYQQTKGSYTGDQNNVIELYTYSAGTITRVATTGNVANIWQTANSGTVGSQALASSATYVMTANTLYFIVFLWHSSATTTAPVLGCKTGMVSASVSSFDFSNSAKYSSFLLAQTNTTSPQAMSSLTGTTSNFWLAVY